MTVREAVSASLSLIEKRDRRRLALAAILQMATSLFDLGGVVLIGLVGVLAASSVNQGEIPQFATKVLEFLGLGDRPTEQATVALGALAAIMLISKSLASLVITRWILRFLAGRCAAASAALSARFLAQPLTEVQQLPSQRVAYALGSGVTAAVTGILGSCVIAVTEVALLMVLGAALLMIEPTVTFIAVAYFGLIALFLHRGLGRWAARLGSGMATADIYSTATVQEAIASYREVTVTDRRDFYRDRFRELRLEAARNYSGIQLVAIIPKYVLEAALVVGAALLTVSQLMAADPVSAVGTLALFLAAGARVMPSILRLQNAATGIRGASGAAAFTFGLARKLRTQNSPRPSGRDADEIRQLIRAGHPDLVPTIEVTDVAVTYPASGDAALSDISLAVGAGKSLALVGPTGAGKSTLADVILGVLEPDTGEVLICGVEPAEAVTRWPGAIAYVPQTVALADGSVRDNVALGLPRDAIDDNLVWHSLNRAHIADFLRDSRDGLDTDIGEHGVRLSGGQRQRLGIARALYPSPRILVLDEATSALDAETEEAITDTLKSLEGEVTTVTIAHRLATVRDADLIVYLESGRVLGRGNFAEVREQVPRFDRQARLLGL